MNSSDDVGTFGRSTPSLSVRPNVTRAGDPTGNTDVSEKLISVKSGLELVLDVVLFPLEHAVTTARAHAGDQKRAPAERFGHLIEPILAR